MTSITRIPATITATATGHKTEGKVVIVAVEELDRLEARCAAAEDVIANIKYPQAGVDNDGYWDALKRYREATGRVTGVGQTTTVTERTD